MEFCQFFISLRPENIFSFKPPMKKYLTFIYLGLSVMSFAQFKENAFDNEHSRTDQEKTAQSSTFETDQSSASALPPGGEQPENPGNPGEPVPIKGLVPILLLSGVALAVYYQRKNNKINI